MDTDQAPAMSTPEPRTALGVVDGVGDPDRIELELPSGAKASLRRHWRGKDLRVAARMAGGFDDQMKFLFGLIAVMVRYDGRALTIEDVDELPGLDVMTLMGRVSGKEP